MIIIINTKIFNINGIISKFIFFIPKCFHTIGNSRFYYITYDFGKILIVSVYI